MRPPSSTALSPLAFRLRSSPSCRAPVRNSRQPSNQFRPRLSEISCGCVNSGRNCVAASTRGYQGPRQRCRGFLCLAEGCGTAAAAPAKSIASCRNPRPPIRGSSCPWRPFSPLGPSDARLNTVRATGAEPCASRSPDSTGKGARQHQLRFLHSLQFAGAIMGGWLSPQPVENGRLEQAFRNFIQLRCA